MEFVWESEKNNNLYLLLLLKKNAQEWNTQYVELMLGAYQILFSYLLND